MCENRCKTNDPSKTKNVLNMKAKYEAKGLFQRIFEIRNQASFSV